MDGADVVRQIGAFLLTVAAVSASAMRPAVAEDYPWCLVYQEMTGAVSCAFTSYEQCRLSTGGNAGFCTENPFYRPTVRAPQRPRVHPRRKR